MDLVCPKLAQELQHLHKIVLYKRNVQRGSERVIWCSLQLRAHSGIAARLMVVRISAKRFPTLSHWRTITLSIWTLLFLGAAAAEQFKSNDLETDHAHVAIAEAPRSTIKSESMSISQTTGQEPTATNRGQMECVKEAACSAEVRRFCLAEEHCVGALQLLCPSDLSQSFSSRCSGLYTAFLAAGTSRGGGLLSSAQQHC